MDSTRNLKIIIVILVVLLGISLFYNSLDSSNSSPVVALADSNSKENRVEPISKLSFNLIQTMVMNYKLNQSKFAEAALNKSDAQSIWFDLKGLKNFITQIEERTKKSDPKINADLLGIRMYYASYPTSEIMANFKDLKSTPKEYERMHTLIMIPTIKVKNVDLDYNPLDVSTYKKGLKNAIIIKEQGKKDPLQKDIKMVSASEVDIDIPAKNHGSIPPPQEVE